MRMRLVGLLALCGVACANTPDVAPRSYLDEQTAATITVVADPWIFARAPAGATLDQRDFLNLYAIDVNRMGDHRQYFAVLQSLTQTNPGGRELPAPTLELRTGADVVSFSPAAESPRDLGVAQPVAQTYTLTSRWWYFRVDKNVLAKVAASAEVQAALVFDGVRASYVLWRDGSAAAAAFTSALP
jgi:hypothetical protein